jgi:hypothetical protein
MILQNLKILVNKPELLAALTALDFVAWNDEMKAANTAFDSQYIARTQDFATASPDNLKSKRFKTNAAYYSLRDMILAHSIHHTIGLIHQNDE